ncbi:hypothetical protein P691DRAFT_787350 [Macrolepiota fuliginosa MF-IS2]|uniref:F-box domain-containing protein n=1 Tax=Macrolepiota fuliginosa MF-IS2 TaxID=1400762 RepID=A0A9P5XLI0_9AGAR|nr:hypothetical protein P691DRAFT_787350 [Macrolepiota fuliginosa MF-IS2]
MLNIPPIPATPSVARDLPSDILIEICSINAFQDAWETYTQQSITGPRRVDHVRDTINASHVCRSWRTALLSAPELWRHMIDPYNGSMAKLMLERSRPYGISFSPPAKRRKGRRELDFEGEMAHEYQERLTEYKLVYNPFGRPEYLTTYLYGSMNVVPLPCLEVLSISSTTQVPHTQRYLFSNFPGRATPNLKRLHLHSWFFAHSGTPQLTILGDSLTHLHLTEIGKPVEVVMDVLASLGRLQSLTLDHVFSGKTPGRPRVDYPLCLVQLREFRLKENRSSNPTSFLRYVHFSEVLSIFSFELDVILKIESINLGPDNALFGSLAGVLRTILSSGPLCALKISCRGGVTYTNTIGDTEPGDWKQPPPRRLFHVDFIPFAFGIRPAMDKYFYIDSPDIDPLWMTYVDAFHSTLSKVGAYSRVESLSIYEYTKHVKDDVMMEILLQCDHVLRITHVDVLLWEFLLESTCSRLNGGGLDQEDCVLPALKDMSFDISGTYVVDPSTSDADSTDSDAGGNTLESPEDGGPELTTAFLYQEIQTLDSTLKNDPKDLEESEGEAGDPTFQYEPGLSDYEDEQDGFYVEDLVEFCGKHANLQRYSEST